MKEQNISKAYAQSMVELAEENKIDIAKELTSLTEVINKSNDLETLLFLDVFSAEEKWSVLSTVSDKLALSQMTKNFLQFILAEKRIGLLPMIIKDVIVIDDHKKGFLRGTIEGSDVSLSEDFKAQIKSYLKSKLGKEPILNYVQNANVTAGLKVTVEDLQLDATLENQLEKFKETVLNS